MTFQDLQKLLRCFNSAAIAVSFRFSIILATFGLGWASVASNNLAWHMKGIRSATFKTLLLKLIISSSEQNHN